MRKRKNTNISTNTIGKQSAMSGEQSVHKVNKEVLRAVVETTDLPSSTQVLESFSEKKSNLEHRLAELDATYGGVMDANQIIARRNEKAKVGEELEQVNSLWSELGGEDIDAASELKGELDFKSDAADHALANSNLSEARTKFYDNFLREYNQSDANNDNVDSVAPVGDGSLPQNVETSTGDSSVDTSVSINATVAPESIPGGVVPESIVSDGADQEVLTPIEEPVAVTAETNTSEGYDSQDEAVAGQDGPEASQAISTTDVETPVDPNVSAIDRQYARVPEFAEFTDLPQPAIEEVFDAAQDLARERRMAEQKEDLDDVEVTFRDNPENLSVVEGLQTAQDRYTRLKAKSETAGRIGRKKRDEELAEAESDLKVAEIMYARAVTEAKTKAGLLESEDPAELRMLMGEQMFSTMRQLINERRAKIKDYRTEKIANANIGMRALGAIGDFFNGGGKWSKRLKAGGVGAGIGAAKTAGILLSGAAWPITIPIALVTGAGIGFGVRGASIVNTLNRQVADISIEGKDNAIMTDDMFHDFMEQFRESTNSIDAMSSRISQSFFDAARTQGYENADAARKEANMAIRRYTAGFGIGAAATSVTTLLVGNFAHAGVSAVPHLEKGTLPKSPDFKPGANDIARGEGWLHQFRDMGMTAKQARAMFSDTDVMKQLVRAHAAYVDNSVRIGGFGINLPKSGHLSAKAMGIIGKAMVAKGF